jgi:hypothetical protein
MLIIENEDKRGVTRKTPYPPNFNKIAASTIEPATGASTWALGSHKWTEKRGYLTINPANKPSINLTLNIELVFCVTLNLVISVKLEVKRNPLKSRKIIRRGKEANTV